MRAEDGQQLDLKTLRGKVVLLNLWATWCPPCIREMPSLDRLQGVLGGPNFEVVALSTTGTAEWDDPAIVAGLRRVVEQKP